MPDSKRFCILRRSSDPRLDSAPPDCRRICEHRSPYGQSVEFLQHRQYTAGDDPRVTGKSGRSRTASTSNALKKTRICM